MYDCLGLLSVKSFRAFIVLWQGITITINTHVLLNGYLKGHSLQRSSRYSH
jgi:hypothetical protein